MADYEPLREDEKYAGRGWELRQERPLDGLVSVAGHVLFAIPRFVVNVIWLVEDTAEWLKIARKNRRNKGRQSASGLPYVKGQSAYKDMLGRNQVADGEDLISRMPESVEEWRDDRFGGRK